MEEIFLKFFYSIKGTFHFSAEMELESFLACEMGSTLPLSGAL